MPERDPGDRYEPLPGLAELPRYLWRRLPRPARVAVAALPVLAVALALLLAPGIDRSKEERARSEAQRRAALEAERIARQRAEQRPRFARSAAVDSGVGARSRRLVARERALSDARRAVLGDSRARARRGALTGPIARVECEPYPRTVEGTGAHDDVHRRQGRYSCLAVRSVIRHEGRKRGVIGHPYRLLIDFETGRYAYCKISGRPAEGSIEADIPVTVPRACGGR